MNSLRKKLIKLAHGKPEFRKHILPLLKEGGDKIAAKSVPVAVLKVMADADQHGYPLKDDSRYQEQLRELQGNVNAVNNAMKQLLKSAQTGGLKPGNMWVDVAGNSLNDFFWGIVGLNKYNQ